MYDKAIKDMKLGVYGLDEKLIEKLRCLFYSVEIVALSKLNRYDALYFDITNGTDHMYQYIAKQSPMPLIIQTKDPDALKKLEFLPTYSYLILTADRDNSIQEIRELFRSYLDRFEVSRRHFHMYYSLIPGFELEDQMVLESKVKKDRRQRLKDEAKEHIEQSASDGNDVKILKVHTPKSIIKDVGVKDSDCLSEKEEKKREIWKEWLVKKGKLDRRELKVFSTEY